MYKSENSIEQSFNRWCKDNGFYRRKLKLNPGRGWPDQAVFLPNNVVVWIEFKGPDGVLSAQQVFVHRQMAKSGHKVHVCRTKDEAVAVVGEYLRKMYET